MKNWFESWFDTKYYHILYKSRDYSEAEFFIKNLVREIDLKPNQNVLDLACGKGRHSIFLNKLGLDVVGVDLSKASIKEAKRFENEHLHFFTHDMREPIANYQFDAIFNLFTSIGYFEDRTDNVKMLKSVHTYLKADGIVIIDFLNQKKVISELVTHEIKTIDNIEFSIKKELVNGFIEKTISFSDENKPYEFMEKVEAITLTDFEHYLNQANFEIIKLAGEYNLQPFDEDISNRLIIFAKKKTV